MSETRSAFHPRPVYVAASYMSRVGKYNGTHLEALSFIDLAEQVSQIFQDSQVRRERIEAVVVGSQNPFAFNHMDNVAAKIAGLLGISGAKSVLIDTATSTGASAFENAYLEVASGRYDRVLAIGIQKMTDVNTEEATKIIAGVIDREEAEYGLTMPACGALVAKSLMRKYKLDDKEWSELAAQWAARAHRFAVQSSQAHLNFPLPSERYMADRDNGRNWLYYDPLRLYDCCPMSDAVAACILTAEPQAVQIVGVGSATDLPTVADRGQVGSFRSTVMAARYAYGLARETLLVEQERVEARFHCATTSFNKDGEPLNSIVLLRAVIDRKRYEFLIGTGPGEYERIQHMRPGQEIRLGKRGDKLTIDEVPVQRLYRKTMEGIVEIADSAWHLLMKRKQRVPSNGQ